MQWQAVGISAIGNDHRVQKLPCQDAAKYKTDSENQIIIGAVSDGMGSARRSEVGSNLAVKTALSQMEDMNCWQIQPSDEKCRDIFCSLLEKVQASLRKEAENEGYSLKDLACTLLVFVATPTWLAAMQVGDGLIVVRSRDDNNYQLLFRPDKFGKKYPNYTTPVTSSNAEHEMQFDVKSGCYEFICAATDGIENISLLKSEGWKPLNGFFKPLEEQIMLSARSLADKEKAIDNFLNSEKINQETDDDKTLLLCAYRDFTNVQNQNTVSQNNLQDQTANTPQSTITGTVQPSTNDTVSQKQKRREDIQSEIAAITDRIYRIFENGAAYGITPEIKIKRSYLVCDLISDLSLNDKDMLSHIVCKAVLDSKILSLIKIKKIEVYNFIKNSDTHCWFEEFNVPNRFLEIVTVITIAAGLTLVFGLIKKLLPGVLGIIICFIFSLIVISCIWFPRSRKD
jgi:Protein phosphatase 2C